MCSDPATEQSMCNELIEYLVRRGNGRRRTQLEAQRAIEVHGNTQQYIRNIGSGVYFIVQYPHCLPDFKGTLERILSILYTLEGMSIVFSRPLVSFSQQKDLSQQLCRQTSTASERSHPYLIFFIHT